MTKLPTMRYLSLGSKVLGVCAQFFILEKQHASTTCSDGFVSIKANSTHLFRMYRYGDLYKNCRYFSAASSTNSICHSRQISASSSIFTGWPKVCTWEYKLLHDDRYALVIANSFFQFSIPLSSHALTARGESPIVSLSTSIKTGYAPI